MYKYLFALFMFFNIELNAMDTDKLLHPTAHIAGSYMITHVTKAICNRIIDSKTTCTIIGATTALSIGLAVEQMQEQSRFNEVKGLAYDAIGTGLAITFISLDF